MCDRVSARVIECSSHRVGASFCYLCLIDRNKYCSAAATGVNNVSFFFCSFPLLLSARRVRLCVFLCDRSSNCARVVNCGTRARQEEKRSIHVIAARSLFTFLFLRMIVHLFLFSFAHHINVCYSLIFVWRVSYKRSIYRSEYKCEEEKTWRKGTRKLNVDGDGGKDSGGIGDSIFDIYYYLRAQFHE